MRIKEIISLIEGVAPLDKALSFDNSGLQVGDVERECTKVLVTLDVTSGAIDRAIEMGANLIVSHHPIIFYPMKRIVRSDVNGAIIMKAIEHGITLYASHTNFDNASGGLTDTIVEKLDPIEVMPFLEDGTGRIAIIEPTRLHDVVEKFKAITGDNLMRVQGDMDRIITKLAIINGAGGRDEELEGVLSDMGVELFVTGESKHSFALLLKERGISLIDIEHYHAERIFNDRMCEIISSSHIEVAIYNESNPYNS